MADNIRNLLWEEGWVYYHDRRNDGEVVWQHGKWTIRRHGKTRYALFLWPDNDATAIEVGTLTKCFYAWGALTYC
jgi:hypothetical protein